MCSLLSQDLLTVFFSDGRFYSSFLLRVLLCWRNRDLTSGNLWSPGYREQIDLVLTLQNHDGTARTIRAATARG